MRAGRVNGVTSKGDSSSRQDWGSSVARHKEWSIRDWAQ